MPILQNESITAGRKQYFVIFNGPKHCKITTNNQQAFWITTRASGAVGVGLSLDPEGRKRLRGSSFALKSREWSFLDFQLLLIFFKVKSHFLDNFVFFNFPQFVPRGEVICDHRMLHFWIFSRLFFFFITFTYSLVYARAFGNRQISSS